MEPYESTNYDKECLEDLVKYFEENKNEVFYSTQLEIIFERDYFHWVTWRVLKELDGNLIRSIGKKLDFGGKATFYWHKSNRYYKRNLKNLTNSINKFSEPDFLTALGQTGELLVNEGFTKYGFRMLGRNTNEFEGVKWTSTAHNLDFIYERDNIRYGVEVKNTLSYMDKKEFDIKIKMSLKLGLCPVFVVRMIPKSWMNELIERGGIFLIMEHQLYPISHKKFADEIRNNLKLPVDAPKALKDGTMERFMKLHNRKLSELKKNSQIVSAN